MATEKQIAANRKNAQKSTGPRTTEGKARSRRNALKHGLAGRGIVLAAPDQKRVKQRIERFKEKLAPIDELEEYLVSRVAMASVRAERAVERETASVRRRVRRAARRWERQQEQQITQLVRRLETEPAEAVRGLLQSARGCSWLEDAWRALGKALKNQGHWTHENAAHAIRLLGKQPEACCCRSGRVARLRLNFLGALPEVDPEEAEAILGLDPEGLDEAARFEAIAARLPEPEAARRALRVMVLRQIRRLERLARKRWEQADGPDRQEVLAIAQVDTSIEGTRLQRYEASHEMGVHRNLNQLIRIRKQEPELSSIARWEKQGKKYSRRWDGYGWVPSSEWRVAEEVADEAKSVAGDAWRVAREGEEETGLTGDELSAVIGSSLCSDPGTRSESEPQIDPEPQEEPRVAGFSALREPGAPQSQLPPADPDPMAQKPVPASQLPPAASVRNEPTGRDASVPAEATWGDQGPGVTQGSAEGSNRWEAAARPDRFRRQELAIGAARCEGLGLTGGLARVNWLLPPSKGEAAPGDRPAR